MTDDAYIEASQRDQIWEGTCDLYVYDRDELIASHGVADSIARELYNALNHQISLDHSCDIEGWNESCSECVFNKARTTALKRYEQTIGKETT